MEPHLLDDGIATAMDAARDALARLPDLLDRWRRTKSWMAPGRSPAESLAHAVADLDDVMNALMVHVEAERAQGRTVSFGVVDSISPERVVITEWSVAPVDAQYTAYAGVYVGPVWCAGVAQVNGVVRRHDLAMSDAVRTVLLPLVGPGLRVFVLDADRRVVEVW